MTQPTIAEQAADSPLTYPQIRDAGRAGTLAALLATLTSAQRVAAAAVYAERRQISISDALMVFGRLMDEAAAFAPRNAAEQAAVAACAADQMADGIDPATAEGYALRSVWSQPAPIIADSADACDCQAAYLPAEPAPVVPQTSPTAPTDPAQPEAPDLDDRGAALSARRLAAEAAAPAGTCAACLGPCADDEAYCSDRCLDSMFDEPETRVSPEDAALARHRALWDARDEAQIARAQRRRVVLVLWRGPAFEVAA